MLATGDGEREALLAEGERAAQPRAEIPCARPWLDARAGESIDSGDRHGEPSGEAKGEAGGLRRASRVDGLERAGEAGELDHASEGAYAGDCGAAGESAHAGDCDTTGETLIGTAAAATAHATRLGAQAASFSRARTAQTRTERVRSDGSIGSATSTAASCLGAALGTPVACGTAARSTCLAAGAAVARLLAARILVAAIGDAPHGPEAQSGARALIADRGGLTADAAARMRGFGTAGPECASNAAGTRMRNTLSRQAATGASGSKLLSGSTAGASGRRMMGASSSLSLTHTEPELSSSSLSTARACPELITAGRAAAGASITCTSDCRARASRYLTSTFCFLRGLITSSSSPSESVSTSLDERAAELTAGPVERRRANRSSDGDAALGALTAPTAATCATGDTLTTSNMSSELGSVSESTALAAGSAGEVARNATHGAAGETMPCERGSSATAAAAALATCAAVAAAIQAAVSAAANSAATRALTEPRQSRSRCEGESPPSAALNPHTAHASGA